MKIADFKIPLLVTFGVLFFDQAVKFWVKTHMALGDEIHIFNWFIIHFTENNGMALGWEIPLANGKMLLSLFRIVASAGVFYYLVTLVQKNAPKGLIISIALIFAGAIGNILDTAFYGILFSGSLHNVAEFLSVHGGYSSFLEGKVVDMFYFPIVQGYYPDWFPFWGSSEFIFFRPVFNVADASISVAVCMIILFQKRYFPVVIENTATEEQHFQAAEEDN